MEISEKKMSDWQLEMYSSLDASVILCLTPRTFHAKIGTIKDRNGMDLTEAENIKKKCQEYTELYKKIFMTQIIMMV